MTKQFNTLSKPDYIAGFHNPWSPNGLLHLPSTTPTQCGLCVLWSPLCVCINRSSTGEARTVRLGVVSISRCMCRLYRLRSIWARRPYTERWKIHVHCRSLVLRVPPSMCLKLLATIKSDNKSSTLYSETCLCDHLKNRDNLEINGSYFSP